MASGITAPLNLVGGGLANVLLALRLESTGRDYRILESSDRLLGDHTWSFHGPDLSPQNLEFIRPLITHSWSGYEVRFPGFTRKFSSPYFTIRSDFARAQTDRLIPKSKILFNHTTVPNEGFNILATGFGPLNQSSGWQKFVGWDVVFDTPHGVTHPILMDATVEQIDGFRFLYVLPLSENKLLVEDTRYSNSASIDADHFAAELKKYIETQWPNLKWAVEREEQAALPIPLHRPGQAGLFGVAGGFFQPVTGYSLPYAVRISAEIAEMTKTESSVAQIWRTLVRRIELRQRYYIWLNRMMFLAAQPNERWRIFARFYQLPTPLIERFYAGESTLLDCIRLVVGRPPVPVNRAIHALIAPTRTPAWS